MLIKIISIMLFLSSCVETAGNLKNFNDDFLEQNHQQLFLGKIEAQPTEVTASIIKREHDKYYLHIISTSQFDPSGMKCPKLNLGDKFLIKTSNKNFHYLKIANEPIRTEKIISLISVGCKEEFEAGPFDKVLLDFLSKQPAVMFRAFGARFHLDGKFTKSHLELLSKLN